VSRAVVSDGQVTMVVDGQATPVVEGSTVSSVLLGLGKVAWRTNAVTGAARGAYCGMGICFECVCTVDGRAGVRACMTPVRAGMSVVTSGVGPPDLGQPDLGQ